MSHEIEPVRQAEEAVAEPGSAELSRRDFVKGLSITAGVMAAGVVPAIAAIAPQAVTAEESGGVHENPVEHFVVQDAPMNYPGEPVYYAKKPAGDQKWAMVIDVNACVGCRRCVYACIQENNIGRHSGFAYIQVLEMEKGSLHLEASRLDYRDAGNPNRWYMPAQCMHCAKPTCVLGCPVKATWKEPDGIVVVDYNKCISCKNCLVTCPYEARHANWVHPEVPKNDINPNVPLEDKAGVVEKCTFCIHRVRDGQTTKCTEACPVGARTFGDLNDPDGPVATILKTKQVFRLKEELGNEPMIWYVG